MHLSVLPSPSSNFLRFCVLLFLFSCLISFFLSQFTGQGLCLQSTIPPQKKHHDLLTVVVMGLCKYIFLKGLFHKLHITFCFFWCFLLPKPLLWTQDRWRFRYLGVGGSCDFYFLKRHISLNSFSPGLSWCNFYCFVMGLMFSNEGTWAYTQVAIGPNKRPFSFFLR